MKAKDFYKTITSDILDEYAKHAGLNSELPIDFDLFMKILPKGKPKLLEVGCGNGRLGIHLIKKTKYTGIDFHKPYLDCFRDKLQEKGIHFESAQIQETTYNKYRGKNFDVVLFPWSVISDFSEEGEQLQVLKKAKDMLKKEAMVIIENFAKGSVRNTFTGYQSLPFYFEDWQDRFSGLGFKTARQILYTTTTGREREITVLIK